MTKKEARDYFLTKRHQLTKEEVDALSLQVFNQWTVSNLINFNTYHIFLPIKNKKEVNTFLFLNNLWRSAKKVYCSKVVGGGLIHYELTKDTELKENSWGIPEPSKEEEGADIESIDCVFIPLLAYDYEGNRVGYGKGYYDRFLQQYPEAKRVGLSFFEPVQKIEDISDLDIPLDYIITPYFFSGFPIEEK